MLLTLHTKPFSFSLKEKLITSQGVLEKKEGWLLHIENFIGDQGWGEISPLKKSELNECKNIIENLTPTISREKLESNIKLWPKALGFGLGAALAELDGLIGSKSEEGWLNAPTSAILLLRNQFLKETLDVLINKQKAYQYPLTLKLKIAIDSQPKEKDLLTQILKQLPKDVRLRLDANEGLNLLQAKEWAQSLKQETRLEWLEQPLPADDLEGLLELSQLIPIALDESLLVNPSLRKSWKGWQVRRPLLEGDPRNLLKELKNGASYRMVSTSFETGIGLRWIHHLAALQQKGPTPTAPGLAPGWCPDSQLFSRNPELVWKAA